MLQHLKLSNREKQVWLEVHNPPLQSLLRGLLLEWNFSILDHPAGETVVVRDFDSDCGTPARISLAASRLHGGQELEDLLLPLVVEKFYAALERQFHDPPRQHMRIALDLAVEVVIGGQSFPSRITSLSDQGCRLLLPQEFARGEEARVAFTVAGQTLAYESRTIYCLSRQRPEVSTLYDLGLLFEEQAAEEKRFLLDFIIFSYLNRVRARLSESDFRTGLEFFHLPAAIASLLGLSRE